MGPVYKVLVTTVVQTTYVLVLLGSVAGLAFGTMLIVDSARVFRINEQMGRWFSTHAWVRPLEAPRKLDLPIYRRHRLIGIALAAWALYALYIVTFSYSTGALLQLFHGTSRPVMLQIIFESAQVILIVLNLFVLALGVALAVKPRLVRVLEDWADRHYATDKYTNPLDEMHYHPDQFVRDHPKLVGWLLVIGSAYILVTLGFLFLV